MKISNYVHGKDLKNEETTEEVLEKKLLINKQVSYTFKCLFL